MLTPSKDAPLKCTADALVSEPRLTSLLSSAGRKDQLLGYAGTSKSRFLPEMHGPSLQAVWSGRLCAGVGQRERWASRTGSSCHV